MKEHDDAAVGLGEIGDEVPEFLFGLLARGWGGGGRLGFGDGVERGGQAAGVILAQGEGRVAVMA